MCHPPHRTLNGSDLTIACTLAADDVAERAVTWSALLDRAVARQSVNGGIALRFPAEPELHLVLGEATFGNHPSWRHSTDIECRQDGPKEPSGYRPRVPIRAKTANEGPIIGNVLVIDDERDLLLLCRINLENSGMAVSCAGSGQDGLQAAFDHTPDAVVLDLMMPQMDGFEVLRRLREDQRTRDVPVVVLSAKTSQEDRDQCYALGADAFITKPFDADELTRELDYLMAQRKRTFET